MKLILIIILLLPIHCFANEWLKSGCITTDSQWRIIQKLSNNEYEAKAIFGNTISRYIVKLKTIKVSKAGQIWPDWNLKFAGYKQMKDKSGFNVKVKVYEESTYCSKLVAKKNLDLYQYSLPKISDAEYNKIKKEHEEYERQEQQNYEAQKKAKEVKEQKRVKKQKVENKELNKLFE